MASANAVASAPKTRLTDSPGDSDLVLASEEEIYQMKNGCICCFVDVRNDLIEVLQPRRRQRGPRSSAATGPATSC